ncbi:TonB-dependent receptor [Roseateles koreensis]|uniref:TonB-dependent receptor n=1 Tax=Roseateles koreensis TaxID=2987526 RepID=A0ABT5KM28_9BURK|nr:TonB-dependent receptor [Roseateles koreensis]MDC8783960.1 TonB-dependent receptor [Roseateles koreensis]
MKRQISRAFHPQGQASRQTQNGAHSGPSLRPTSWAVTALLTLGLQAAHAQTPPAPAEAPANGTAAATDTAKLDAVIVSGQGRTQQLQSVPIAIQVMSADQLRKLGATNMGELNSHIPGLDIDSSQATQPVMSMRGIGSSDFGIGTDAPVGIYMDGVYTGKSGGAMLNFNDIKRVEVLKGPQGTLFGRNSAGGAISIVSNDPAFKSEGQGLLRLGDYGERHLEALVNHPLSDTLALRASFVSQRSDGYVRDAGTGQLAGDEGAWGAKIALKWLANDDTNAVLSIEHEKLDQGARPAFGLVKEVSNGGPLPFPVQQSDFIDPRHAPLYNDVLGNREKRDYDGATLRIEHSLPWAEFKSTTAYRHFNTVDREDNDGTRNPNAYLSTTNLESNTSLQQEFRLTGKAGALDWLAGLSLYEETAKQSSLIDVTTTGLDTVTSNLLGMPLFSTVNSLAQMSGIPGINLLGLDWQEAMHNEGRYRAAALYGDAIWHLNPSTNITAGLRVTRDQKRFSWYNPPRTAANLDAQLAVLDQLGMFPGLVAAGALSQTDADTLQTAMRNNGLVVTSGASNSPLVVEHSWNDVSPRLVIDHKLQNDLMVYASITRGYQAGGYNTLQVNSLFQPEHVTNGELGLKGQVASQGLSYSAALFSYRFDNLQTLDLVPAATPGGLPAYQVTISDQQATGLDLEGRWQINRQLRLSGAMEYIDQTYRTGRSSGGEDLAGLPVGTPKFSGTLGADYLWAALGGTANAGVQASYSSARRCNPKSYTQGECLNTTSWHVNDPRQRWDVRLGWDSAADTSGRRWGLGLLVKNLLNEQHVQRVGLEAAPFGSAFAALSKPRTIAVELRGSY